MNIAPDHHLHQGAGRWLSSLLLLGSLSVTGCHGSYLLSNGSAVVHGLASSIPIEQLSHQPDLSPAARARLAALPGLLEFASDRGLRVGGAYRRVESTEGPASWIVAAADPLTVKLHLWKFPIVGVVPYKGFRFREHAEREAKRLSQEGLIVEVLPVSAWSSLGWFPEPLPSTLLQLEEHRFATTVLHELVHRTIHIAGESDLNEGLATFLGAALAEEWLIEQYGEEGEAVARHRSRERDEKRLNQLLRELQQQLQPADLERNIAAFRQQLAEQPWHHFSGEQLASSRWTLPRILLAQVYDPERIPWRQLWLESTSDVKLLENRILEEIIGTGADKPSLER
ncbi:MAG: aminopeptidase [Planctomycetota bacterium]|nr:aminopeptidase [Planctomycetota bacterium]